MKTKHLFLVVLTAAGIASCKQQPLPQEEPHQIESIAELFDSLTARDKSAWCFLSCSEDSVLTESYQASISMPDTTDINKHDEEYKRYIRQWIQDYDFALQNATRLFDELCPKAEKSYRYTSKDSLDYSITLSNKPENLLSMKERIEKYVGPDGIKHSMQVININTLLKKPVKNVAKPNDVSSIQATLKKFIAEQKNAKKYEAKYEWDQGVDMPDLKQFNRKRDDFYTESFNFPRSEEGKGADSLAASSVTGTHYFIPAKEEQWGDIAGELYQRMYRLLTQKPIIGVYMQTPANIQLSLGEIKTDKMIIGVYDHQNNREDYKLLMNYARGGIHILEVYAPDAPRYTIPRDWYRYKGTHNTEFIVEEDFKVDFE